jgi:hypothetical protein
MRHKYPRLRYILVTMTQERGLTVESYSISSSAQGQTVHVNPTRFIAAPEFDALSQGLSQWQQHYLCTVQAGIAPGQMAQEYCSLGIHIYETLGKPCSKRKIMAFDISHLL